MAKLRFNFRSQELRHYVDVTVVIPTDHYAYSADAPRQNLDKREHVLQPGMKYRTVYLIHGGGDDDTLTYRYTNAERYAEDSNVMLVTPDIANSFGLDTEYGVNYQTFLSRELPAVIRALFPSSSRREDNFIVGYAMGGNVALGTALLHPELYAECVDISGGIGMTLATETLQSELEGDFFRQNFGIYNSSFGKGSTIPGSDRDILSALERDLANGMLPALHILCGSKEFIRERVEGDVRVLREKGIHVDFRLEDGYDHNFAFWDHAIHEALSDILPLG